MPKSSTPALLLITVRSFVPRACSAAIRFSGMPHRPKPPMRMVAPSGMSATASSALASTLFIASTIADGLIGLELEFGMRSRFMIPNPYSELRSFDAARQRWACSKTSARRSPSREVGAQFLQQRDEGVERLADLIGVGGGDVLPDLGRARGEPGRVDEAAAGERQAVLAHRIRRPPASGRWRSAAGDG